MSAPEGIAGARCAPPRNAGATRNNKPAAHGAVRPRALSVWRLAGSTGAVAAGVADPITGLFTALHRIFCPISVSPEPDRRARRQQGRVFVLGGIEGPSRYAESMRLGVRRSGFPGEIVVFPWNRGSSPWNLLRNLASSQHHERQAARLAESIRRYVRAHPRRAVGLVAQSGGCWIVVRALERLRVPERVRATFLLAPAISPGHDLGAAAARCERGLYTVGGPGDWFYLGLGTLLFGTSDRRHAISAGLSGWRCRAPGVHELRWRPSWLRYGYLGNHTTTAQAAFISWLVRPVFGDREDPGVDHESRRAWLESTLPVA